MAILPLLSACGSAPVVFEDEDGAPPRHSVDIDSIRDPIPQYEAHSRYGNPESYTVAGRRYHVLDSSAGYVERGIASWYGTKFHGKRTSSGEPYDMYAMTAAHKTLPLPTYARVTNLNNGRSVVVRINDRGPFVKNRLIDLSYVAARKLGVFGHGTAPVEVRTLQPGQDSEPPLQQASYDELTDTEPVYLQVGAFSERTNAERLRRRLRRLPLPRIEIKPAALASGTVYRVRIGPLNGSREVNRVAAALSRHGLHGSHTVHD